MDIAVTVLAGLAIIVGLAGIVLPVLPGLLIVWAAVAVWTLVVQTGAAWFVFVLATALTLAGWVLQYLIPGKRLRAAGVPNRSTIIGLVAGIVGFFAIPVLGLPLGFVGGVYLAELARIGKDGAWESTQQAVKAAAISYGIEMLTGMLIAGTFIVGAWISLV
ncbi:hypothetical protein BJY21_000189 [Kineosphaera limosa]|uniref:DUF456 domain-containing protein n=1 Tax=Kineosphaera limosa NBRC 100340 TaxID=1184609 RepID=K6WVG0_9MICO|nr:DUF456 domain-containing protein [Kineosphaera limosa]NYD99004.1 hypothetical protein [Kineosphaera limosa]GAB97791.1 hypothetical protein KILIM_082_00080 [Kineosphaera limosa NBRC 100340]